MCSHQLHQAESHLFAVPATGTASPPCYLQRPANLSTPGLPFLTASSWTFDATALPRTGKMRVAALLECPVPDITVFDSPCGPVGAAGKAQFSSDVQVRGSSHLGS